MSIDKLQEKDLQVKIIEFLKDESLLEKIVDLTILEMSDEDQEYSQKTEIPQLNVDSFLDHEFLLRAKKVYKSLQASKIVSGEKITNISMDRKARMFPDILLHGVETNAFIICELKTSGKTSREAITELLAYIHEVRNHVPLISDADIHIIVIANEFNELLSHAICSLMMSTGISILCLQYSVLEDEIELSVKLPNKWTTTGVTKLLGDSLQSYGVYLYYDEPDLEDEEVLNLSFTACDLVAVQANKLNMTGFVFAWEDVESSDGCYKFGYTVVSVNPYSIFQGDNHTQLNGEPLTDLADYLSKYVNENGTDQLINSAYEINAMSEKLLRRYCNPTIEGFVSWNEFKTHYGKRFAPVYCKSFGLLELYTTQMFVNEPVRNLLLSQNAAIRSSMTSPQVFFDLITQVTEDTPFHLGKFTCKSIFDFGKNLCTLLGILQTTTAMDGEKINRLHPSFFWRMISFKAALFEVRYRENATSVFVSMPSMGISYHPGVHTDEVNEGLTKFCDWFLQIFLKEYHFQQQIFMAALEAGLIYDKNLPLRIHPNQYQEMLDKLKKIFFDLAKSFFADKRSSISCSQDELVEISKNMYGLDLTKPLTDVHLQTMISVDTESRFAHFIDLMDHFIPAVFHAMAPLKISLDFFEHIKREVIRNYNNGSVDIAVHISEGGVFNIIARESHFKFVKSDGYDVEKEVFVFDESNGVQTYSRRTWVDFMKTWLEE